MALRAPLRASKPTCVIRIGFEATVIQDPSTSSYIGRLILRDSPTLHGFDLLFLLRRRMLNSPEDFLKGSCYSFISWTAFFVLNFSAFSIKGFKVALYSHCIPYLTAKTPLTWRYIQDLFWCDMCSGLVKKVSNHELNTLVGEREKRRHTLYKHY